MPTKLTEKGERRRMGVLGLVFGAVLAAYFAFQWHNGVETPTIFFILWLLLVNTRRQALELNY